MLYLVQDKTSNLSIDSELSNFTMLAKYHAIKTLKLHYEHESTFVLQVISHFKLHTVNFLIHQVAAFALIRFILRRLKTLLGESKK